jgi:hypothetical protein
MRYVDRSRIPAPEELSAAPFRNMREEYLAFLQLHPKERAQTRPPDRHLPQRPSLLPALDKMFLGKCAFCEGHSSLSVYRFRPTSEALPLGGSPEANLCYGWLADTWQNLYPICWDCRPATPNNFPVSGPRSRMPTPDEYEKYLITGNGMWHSAVDEAPDLLDPCEKFELAEHLEPRADGTLVARSKRGTATLDQFKLNREALLERRRLAVVNYFSSPRASPDPEREFYGFLTALVQVVRKPAASTAPRKARPRRRATTPSPQAKTQVTTRWRIEAIEIEAFKSLERLRIEFPASEPNGSVPALLVLGENAAGKSSLLEAIALTMMTDEARKALNEDPAKLLLDPSYVGGTSLARRDRGKVSLTFVDSDGHRLERSLMLTPRGFQTKGPLPEGFSIFAYGAYRHYRDDFRGWQPDRPVISLFRSDNLLSNPERWLLDLSEDRFDMVVQALRYIFGGGFRYIERDPKTRRCLMVIQQEKAESRVPLSSASSGFRTILALTCDVMRWLTERDTTFTTLTMAQGLVLIDEVEAHLHPRWKVTIMDGLRRALPKVTFIVTTHDPLCLRGMRDGEVLVLQRIPGAATGSELPMTVETITKLPDVTKLTIEQLLTSDLFNLFDTDDPVTGQAMADLADALALQQAGQKIPEARMQQLLTKFRDQIEDALPVGSTEVSRLVQDAVADYVIKRRGVPEKKRLELRNETKALILRALDRA